MWGGTSSHEDDRNSLMFSQYGLVTQDRYMHEEAEFSINAIRHNRMFIGFNGTMRPPCSAHLIPSLLKPTHVRSFVCSRRATCYTHGRRLKTEVILTSSSSKGQRRKDQVNGNI